MAPMVLMAVYVYGGAPSLTGKDMVFPYTQHIGLKMPSISLESIQPPATKIKKWHVKIATLTLSLTHIY